MARAKKVAALKAEEVVVQEEPAVAGEAMVVDTGVVMTEDPKATNIVTLSNILSQSLKSGDSQLLETALGVSDEAVIEASLDRLPSLQVPALLNALLKRIHDRPSRLKHLLPWIRGTMIVHASYIRSCDEAKKALSQLKDVMEQRLQNRDSLLALSGRLDLILMQVMRKTNNMAAGSEQMVASVVNTPMVVYEDDGEDANEMGDDDVMMGNNQDENEDDEEESEEESAEEESGDESDSE